MPLRNRRNIADARLMTTIYKWDDGYGKIIYLNPDVPHDQVQVVSARITAQQEAFQALDPSQQTQIRSAFQPTSPTTPTSPYGDYLKSEALGKRFTELKPNPTRPSGPK